MNPEPPDAEYFELQFLPDSAARVWRVLIHLSPAVGNPLPRLRERIEDDRACAESEYENVYLPALRRAVLNWHRDDPTGEAAPLPAADTPAFVQSVADWVRWQDVRLGEIIYFLATARRFTATDLTRWGVREIVPLDPESVVFWPNPILELTFKTDEN